MILRPRDFLTTSAFAAVALSIDVRGLEHAFALAISTLNRGSCLRRPPSALYAFPSVPLSDELGSVSTRPVGGQARVFADFDGCHLGRFPPRAQIESSPLCLPVPPLGRSASSSRMRRLLFCCQAALMGLQPRRPSCAKSFYAEHNLGRVSSTRCAWQHRCRETTRRRDLPLQLDKGAASHPRAGCERWGAERGRRSSAM